MIICQFIQPTDIRKSVAVWIVDKNESKPSLSTPKYSLLCDRAAAPEVGPGSPTLSCEGFAADGPTGGQGWAGRFPLLGDSTGFPLQGFHEPSPSGCSW